MQDKSLIKNISRGINNKLSAVFNNPYRVVNLNWLKLKYYKHLPPGKERQHWMFGHPVHFKSPAEFLHGIKEIFLENIYAQKLPSKPYIIDCGANIGLSVIYIKEQHPEAKIVAFEPDDENFRLLQKNISSFGYSNVELRKEAVWTEKTTLKFRNESSMSSRIESSDYQGGKDVPAVRLKDEITIPVDFLKIDIEGAEFSVISDIEDRLNLVNNLFIEYHGTFSQIGELTRLFEIVSRSGFVYYIKEAASIFQTPFARVKNPNFPFDLQLNIFCFREEISNR
jgi:FkbM family methyltransferase